MIVGLVERNDKQREVISSVLEGVGMECLSFRDGSEVKGDERKRAKMWFVDTNQSEGSLEKIRELCNQSKSKMILLGRNLHLGDVDRLSKPVHVRKLILLLHRILVHSGHPPELLEVRRIQMEGTKRFTSSAGRNGRESNVRGL